VVIALFFSFLMLLPIIWMVCAAFRPDADITRFPPTLWPRDLTLQNFIQVFQRLPLARMYGNTVVFAGSVTVISLIFDSMAGYALACLHFRGRAVMLVATVGLLLLPFQVTLVPLYELMHTFNLVNTLPGLIIPRMSSAFGIFFMRQFFLSMPPDLGDAARIDGAGEFRVFRSVMLPLAGPALATLGLFQFQANWNDLIWPLIMTNRVEDSTLPAGLAQFVGQHSIEYGQVMAGATLTLLPIIVLFLLVQRTFITSFATTGLK
jgi:multiple sugar transport system permease protein